jgi:hypothetical protein
MYNEFFEYVSKYKNYGKQMKAGIIKSTFKRRATDERLLPEFNPDAQNAKQMRKDHLIFRRQGAYYEKLMNQ